MLLLLQVPWFPSFDMWVCVCLYSRGNSNFFAQSQYVSGFFYFYWTRFVWINNKTKSETTSSVIFHKTQFNCSHEYVFAHVFLSSSYNTSHSPIELYTIDFWHELTAFCSACPVTVWMLYPEMNVLNAISAYRILAFWANTISWPKKGLNSFVKFKRNDDLLPSLSLTFHSSVFHSIENGFNRSKAEKRFTIFAMIFIADFTAYPKCNTV